MIEVNLRQSETEESIAANKLRELIEENEKNLSTACKIYVISNVQCYGQNPQDIDLMLFYDDPEGHKATEDGRRICSFIATIEVKGHSRDSIQFEGATCEVKYNGSWHNVSDQSERQKYSAKSYIESSINNKIKSPFINNIIWLTNLPSTDLPKTDHNILGSDAKWQDFIDKIILLNPDRGYKSIKACWKNSAGVKESYEIFSRKITMSKKDRRSIEALSKNIINKEKQKWAKNLGSQLLIIRGRGGTGKTVRLIQIANYAYDETGLRALILTYNKSLVADINRTLAIQGIRNSIGSKGMSVKTIHSFIRQWMVGLGVIENKTDNFLEKYEGMKEQTIELIENEVIQENDVEKCKRKNSRELMWDLLFIDESQDWPETERDLLYKFYSHHNIVIADGVDQLVRSNDPINWRVGITNKESQVVRLYKCMRTKHQLCRAINTIASLLNIADWDLEPMPEVDGGKLYVVTGDGLSENLHRKLLKTSQSNGNKPIDLLYCVPPAWVEKTNEGRASKLSNQYSEWGQQTWDGTQKDTRENYPTSVDQFRIVQYDSCRGLEGWTVVCFALDKFYDYKIQSSDIDLSEDLLIDEQKAKIEHANQWLMIPLTRAIDTLILHIEDPSSDVYKILEKAKEMHPETIEIMPI
ncbi:AAA family ATPase [Synechococcus sp. MIT S1220]|uniref:AAA family ATPase n=1 Tax=Synechococcus sp. MIT S1220 TaxID=3082549 RepID=UPI0039AEF768